MSFSSVNFPKESFQPKNRTNLHNVLTSLKSEADKRKALVLSENVDKILLSENVDKIREILNDLNEEQDDSGSFYESTIISPPLTLNRLPHEVRYLDGIQEVESISEPNLAIASEEPDLVISVEEPETPEMIIVPFWVDLLPNLALVFCISVYLIGGTFFLQYLDPGFATMPFHELFFLPFMICSTVGWGHITATVNSSRLFEVIYALIGVPLTFAFLANIGRMIAEICTSNKFTFINYLTDKPKSEKIKMRQLSISAAFGLFSLHMFCAIPLFGLLFDELKVTQSLYFNFISIGCIGYGDIAPKPKNLLHAILMVIFFSIGIVITGALF
uniref:Potassium channel domain-containing protein n=1 Tax=Panagrolaimus sp. JU765 TaxID=591449 RepID=A0AC34QGA5_9BILA